MKKGTISLLEFAMYLCIGIAILFALLYPYRSFATLLFSRSQACLDDQTKSSVDLITKDLEFLKDNEESSSIINLNGEDCAFFVFDKKTPSDIIPPPDLFNKNIALCICKLSDNECVGEFYCQDETTSDILKSFNSINFEGYEEEKRHISSEEERYQETIHYMKQSNLLIFSKNPFSDMNTEPADETSLSFSNPSEIPYSFQGTKPDINLDIYPLGNPQISSCYGPRILGGKSDWHDGIDFSVPEGTEVKVVMDGDILETCQEPCSGYGNSIIIKHADNFYTRYSHLSEIKTSLGHINKGDVIGLSGNTGFSTAPHLDFKVYFSDKEIHEKDPEVPYYDRDPLNFLPELQAYNFASTAASCRSSQKVIELAQNSEITINGISPSYISGSPSKVSLKTINKYDPNVPTYIAEANRIYPQVPISFLNKIIQRESNFNPNALNKYDGGLGIAQFMDDTAKSYGLMVVENNCRILNPTSNVKYSINNCDFSDERLDPKKSVIIAAKLLNDLLNNPLVNNNPRYTKYQLAAVAYNAGPGRLNPSSQCEGKMIWECSSFEITKDYTQYIGTSAYV